MKTFMSSAALLGLLALPAVASAQESHIFVAPYVGATFGGGDLAKDGAPTIGASAGWLGSSWGFEGDVGDTAGFFEQDGFRTDRRVMTVMGNALVRLPLTMMDGVMAYGAGGLGLIRTNLAEAGGLASVDVKQAGFNVGAGLTWMKQAVGVRGDVRYFRGFGDEVNDVNAFGLDVSTIHFVRASVGLVVTF